MYWRVQEGLIENIEEERKDFIAARDLRPLKLAVLGPPAVGKSFVADKLAAKYTLDVIRARDALEEIIREPVRFSAPDEYQPTNEDLMSGEKPEAKEEEGKGGDEEGKDDEGGNEEEGGEETEDLGIDRAESEFANQLRKKVKEVLQEKQRLPEGLMGVVVRWVISSPRHKNRGYILDGFPRSYKEAEALLSEESGEGKQGYEF
jgi:adenylate kinase